MLQSQINFVIKNYKGKSARVFSFFIQVAIIVRGGFSLLYQLIKRLSQSIFSGLTRQKCEPQEVLAFANTEEFNELGLVLWSCDYQNFFNPSKHQS
jgi:hypothetical protein